MASHGTFAPIAGLMFLTGIGIPVMATFSAGLGQQLGSPVLATLVLFVVGALLIAAITLTAGPPVDWSRFTFDRPYLYFGAAFMLFYALSITWAAPRTGIGNAVFFVLLGQTVASALIDHFGLWGATASPLTLRRIGGILLMAVGVYLARRPI